MSVLVYIEQRDGVVKKASLEALSEGKRLAEKLGGAVHAVICGASVDGHVDTLKQHGAEKIFVQNADDLEHYNAEGHLAVVAEAAQQADAKVVMVSATALGRDLGPRVAAKMQVMILPDVTEINPNGEEITVRRPVYAGKVHYLTKSKVMPVVITTRPNMFDVAEAAGAGERVELSASYEIKSKVVKVEKSGGETLDVAEADRIVAGGRGLGEPENFKVVEELAATLGAAVGASRAVVDNGWRPHSEQVGQTGKTVAPSLYIAIGISGAVQHLAGMRTAKTIVAINKDPDAPIFKTADYGLVGDAMQVVPALNDALK
ncbi:electron transfer flavoprotein subunit alpha/FixB family protein [bacterium]|nr:electron transfer flavoprotein subunit alpha/FixB family protein [bacterium]